MPTLFRFHDHKGGGVPVLYLFQLFCVLQSHQSLERWGALWNLLGPSPTGPVRYLAGKAGPAASHATYSFTKLSHRQGR
jgi:hypothetical protein